MYNYLQKLKQLIRTFYTKKNISLRIKISCNNTYGCVRFVYCGKEILIFSITLLPFLVPVIFNKVLVVITTKGPFA